MPKFSLSFLSLLFTSLLAVVFGSAALADEPEAASAFEQGAVFLEADEMFEDAETGRYIARGSVEARYQNRILRADEVIYFPNENRVHASGSVVVVEPDGTVSFADEVELNNDLVDGVALGFYSRMANQATIGATHAIHSDNGRRNTLKKAFYTACEACGGKDGKSGKPTWRLRAREAEQNLDDGMIYYRDAVFEVKGIPILYSPYFAHADPTVGRKSGLLFPNVGQSKKYGWYYEQPYYKTLSDSSDVTITPRVFTGKRPFIFSDYRKRFYSGSMRLRGGITQEQEFDGTGARFGNDTIRGYILGEGKFRLNKNWYWGFGAEAVSDDLLFLRYDIAYVDNIRGLFRNSSLRLSNQLFAVGQGTDYYASIAGIRYQGLQAADVDNQLPIVAPLVNAKKIISNNFAGGKLALSLNTAVLTRIDGIDSRRASTRLDWQRRFVSKQGIIAKPYAQLRGDYYNIENQAFIPDLGTSNQNLGRVLGVAGTEIRWPWLKAGKNINWIIEPIAHLSASPNGDNVGTFDIITVDNLGNTVRTPTSLLPNEDSITSDFDETNLFRPSRFAGYDQWEDGLRANVGGRISARWGQSGFTSLTAGRSFRSTTNTGFLTGSSLQGKTSDYVAGINFSTGTTLKISSHIRLDQDDFSVKRFDVSAVSAFNNDQLGPLRSVLHSVSANVRYSNTPANTLGVLVIDELIVGGQAFLTKNWGLSAGTTFDFEIDQNRNSFAGLVYADNCSRFELLFQRRNTIDRTLSTGNSIKFRFTLLSLGSFGG
ncbi:hypothetical protein MNBD_ALPHA06-574 [hydrothermal vent metagenome]|uniref:LptD C-terminal domain-containing protein n=1 Tax=hydrothermal vent metagenome TaxID=652676 RepID=A0A3B0SEP4_9ZZZZ